VESLTGMEAAHPPAGMAAAHPPAGIEAALGATQQQAEANLKLAGTLLRELRRVKGAAAGGQVRELRRALSAATGLAQQLSEAAAQARTGFDFDEAAYLASGGYAKEVLALAAERNVTMFEEDDRLLCYPSLVRILPADAAIEIDRRRDKRIRPSVVVDLLAELQQRPPKFRAEQFLESLAGGYELVIAQGGKRQDAVVRLVDVWAVLTLLPGQAREYPKPEFARDLYLLDHDGACRTRRGRVLRWHASSGTRAAGVLTTVAASGQKQRYWGVSFTSPEAGG
jgi:hypothetical protein